MSRLTELATKYGTDKIGHGYLDHYEQRFWPFCQKPVTVLEIGVMGGASLRMWREYFPRGLIYGVDIDPPTMIEGEERIKTFCGPQNDAAFLESVWQETKDFDLVIDDGSHCGKDHLASFQVLWPHLRDGGWYCIEDCQSIFNVCWTQPGDNTILVELSRRWRDIVRGQDTIREVVILGNWIYSGLIMLRKDVVRAET